MGDDPMSRYVPDQAASLRIRSQLYRRHPIEPTLWTRESDEVDGYGMPVQFTTAEIVAFGGTVDFYDERGDKLL